MVRPGGGGYSKSPVNSFGRGNDLGNDESRIPADRMKRNAPQMEDMSQDNFAKGPQKNDFARSNQPGGPQSRAQVQNGVNQDSIVIPTLRNKT